MQDCRKFNNDIPPLSYLAKKAVINCFKMVANEKDADDLIQFAPILTSNVFNDKDLKQMPLNTMLQHGWSREKAMRLKSSDFKLLYKMNLDKDDVRISFDNSVVINISEDEQHFDKWTRRFHKHGKRRPFYMVALNKLLAAKKIKEQRQQELRAREAKRQNKKPLPVSTRPARQIAKPKQNTTRCRIASAMTDMKRQRARCQR